MSNKSTETNTEKYNMRIHITKDIYLLGNGYEYIIAKESQKKDKNGKTYTDRKRLSGHSPTIEYAFESTFVKSLRNAKIEGEIEDLVKLIVKTRKEIRGWQKQFDKAIDDALDELE